MTDDRVARAGWRSGDLYRTVPERDIRDFLLLSGWAFERHAGQTGLGVVVAAALERLVGKGLPYTLREAGRCFDPVETLNFIKWCCLSGMDSLWADRFVTTGRRLVEDSAMAGAGPQEVSIAFRRTFDLDGVSRDRAVRLRLPLPIAQPSLAQAHIDIACTGGLTCTIATDRCRIEARGIPQDEKILTIGADFRLSLDPGAPDLDAGDLNRYLLPHEGLIQLTPRVAREAAELAGALTDRRTIVGRFFDFFLDRLCLGAVHYDLVEAASSPTDWVLETGWFDCQLGAALLAAFCRAQGIPSRLIGGYSLYPLAPTPHFWTEIWFEDGGWLPFDLACWDLSAGGRDARWRQVFAGRIDARLTTQRMPLQFTGPPGVPLPSPWYVLSVATQDQVRTGLYSAETLQTIFEDQLIVTPIGPSHRPRFAPQT